MLKERDIVTILGDLCEFGGTDFSPAEQEEALTALSGVVRTSDKGERLYYVDIETISLPNVDIEEGIWGVPEDGLLLDGGGLVDLADDRAVLQHGLIRLTLICDTMRLASLQEKWLAQADLKQQLEWQRLLERVVQPLRSLANCPGNISA